MVRFQVSDVDKVEGVLSEVDIAPAIAKRLRFAPEALEAWGCTHGYALVATTKAAPRHALIEAVHTAFDAHYPLALSPDDVWLCIAQGFAKHVEVNAEALRGRFVRHAGSVTLEVRRDGFVKGSPGNDWQGCFAAWSNAIAGHIGKHRDLLVSAFSTTGAIERAASEIVLMDSMKSYFEYRLVTRCGIPEVELLGTVEDWRAIRRRAEVLAEYDLGPWVARLVPVLDQLVQAAAGAPERAFWRSIYKEDGGSGGPYVNGWINVLFPYRDCPVTKETYRNPSVWDTDDHGTPAHGFPSGVSRVPLTWAYLGTELKMQLHAGFVGVAQDRGTGALRPAIGWAVSDATDQR